MVWTAAIVGGILTFHYFEPLYDRIQQAAIRGGYVRVLGFDFGAAAVPQFDTRVSTVAPPFRGTIAASQGKAAPARKTVVLNANTYGHFQAVAEINGQQVEFMTDTGATYVALSYETAQKLGITQNLRFTGRSTTANGVARVASIEISEIRDWRDCGEGRTGRGGRAGAHDAEPARHELHPAAFGLRAERQHADHAGIAAAGLRTSRKTPGIPARTPA